MFVCAKNLPRTCIRRRRRRRRSLPKIDEKRNRFITQIDRGEEGGGTSGVITSTNSLPYVLEKHVQRNIIHYNLFEARKRKGRSRRLGEMHVEPSCEA